MKRLLESLGSALQVLGMALLIALPFVCPLAMAYAEEPCDQYIGVDYDLWLACMCADPESEECAQILAPRCAWNAWCNNGDCALGAPQCGKSKCNTAKRGCKACVCYYTPGPPITKCECIKNPFPPTPGEG